MRDVPGAHLRVANIASRGARRRIWRVGLPGLALRVRESWRSFRVRYRSASPYSSRRARRCVCRSGRARGRRFWTCAPVPNPKAPPRFRTRNASPGSPTRQILLRAPREAICNAQMGPPAHSRILRTLPPTVKTARSVLCPARPGPPRPTTASSRSPELSPTWKEDRQSSPNTSRSHPVPHSGSHLLGPETTRDWGGDGRLARPG